MSGRAVGAHNELHSDQGARKEEHPGRSRDPIIKVHDIAWLEFEKPDLARAETFSQAFGFSTALRTTDELCLRGTDSGSPCVLIRRGPRSTFVGTAYTARDHSDVLRLARATRTRIRALPAVGKMIPINNLIVVLFPAPFGPKNPNTSPSSTCMVKFSSDVLRFKWRNPYGYSFVRFCVSMAGAVMT